MSGGRLTQVNRVRKRKTIPGERQSGGISYGEPLQASDLPNVYHKPHWALTSIPRYRPLHEGEIRLVDFGAQGRDSALVHVQIDSRTRYVAVSYCWGAENCLHPFSVNGQCLILTSSLHRVFIELQRRGYRGKVWADAVCIDQSNDEEKSVQIPLMGKIYRNAYEVFAWLGQGRPDQRLKSGLIMDLCDLLSGIAPSKSFVDVIKATGPLPHQDDTVWNELAEMLMSTWFDRLWTLQEAILSGHLTLGYGSITINWRYVFELQKVLYSVNFDSFWDIRGLTTGRGLIDPLTRIHNLEYCRRRFRLQKLRLSDLFGEARGKKATMARDKVYALYSLTSPEFRHSVPIDLGASTQRVFIRAAKALIKQDPEGLIPLSYAENEPKLPGLPSWVFDPTTPNAPWRLGGFCGYNAGLAQGVSAQPWISYDDDDDTLSLSGFQLDTIVTVLRPTIADFDISITNAQYWQKAQKAVQWIQACLQATKSALKLPESQALLIISRTLVCDRPVYEVDPRRRYTDTTTGKLQRIRDQLQRAADQATWDWGRASEYYRSLVAFQRSRSFFLTRAGHVGIGPHKIQAGDQVVILHGGEVPFAIRKRQSSVCYELLGECFVDGVMEGQAVQRKQGTRAKDQTFCFD